MTFIRPQQDLHSPKLTEEFLRAIVVDNNDPSNLGRVKIRILEIHGTEQDIPDDNLPWAIQMRPAFLGGASNLSTFSVPRVGSEVIVTHIKGDVYQPAYIFELYNAADTINENAEDYPESYGFKDSDENYYHVNMEQNTLKIKFNGDEFIEITKNRETIIGQNEDILIAGDRQLQTDGSDTQIIGSNQSISISQNQNIDVGSNFTINITGGCNITSGGACNITAPTINLNGTGNGVLTTASINPLTGSPFPDGSSTVFTGDG